MTNQKENPSESILECLKCHKTISIRIASMPVFMNPNGENYNQDKISYICPECNLKHDDEDKGEEND